MSAQLSDRALRTGGRGWKRALALASVLCVVVASLYAAKPDRPREDEDLVAEGREIFRFDTFGDEQLWTDQLRMHEVIEAAVDPITALQILGLKVDVDALPDELLFALAMDDVDLTDPATTVTLLKLDAVVGVIGQVETIDGVDRLVRVGVSCALCHSTVDNSFAPGIGHRLDGWANVDLDPGKIIASSD